MSSLHTRCNAIPVAHVDLATLTALEAYLYGGSNCTTWVMREVNKANWAAVGMTTLRNTGGKPDYGRETSWLVSRGGDHLIHAFFRARFPLIKLKKDAAIAADASIRYCKNFMHNLVKSGSLTVNELCISVIDTFILDVRQAFYLPANKSLGYKNLIGDVPTMTSMAGFEVGDDVDSSDFAALGTGGFFTLVLPFFFEDDHGVSLPTASLIYVELYINLEFADFEDLIIVHPGTAEDGNSLFDVHGLAAFDDADEPTGGVRGATISDVEVCGRSSCRPSMEDGELWAQYVIVANDERKAMAKMKRTMVIHGHQRMQEQSWEGQKSNHYNLRFSYSVKAVFTAARNDSTAGDNSNYTTLPFNSGVDPIHYENIQYENSNRTGDLHADITSLVQPYLLMGVAVPEVTGIHLTAAFALDLKGLDASYAPNFGKINQIVLNSYPSEAARLATHATPQDHFGALLVDADGNAHVQQFTKMVLVVHQSLINVGSGTITVPVV